MWRIIDSILIKWKKNWETLIILLSLHNREFRFILCKMITPGAGASRRSLALQFFLFIIFHDAMREESSASWFKNCE